MMPTLVIHHPETQVAQNRKKSFDQCCKSGIGKGFAIPLPIADSLKPGDRVVILCKTPRFQRRAEGSLVQLDDSGERTANGMVRYHVHTKDINEVAYDCTDLPKLRRTGIAVF